MSILNVLAAGIASYIFGAIWYMSLSTPWMEASGVAVGPDGKPANSKEPLPYIVGFICTIIVAAAMNHFFIRAGISQVGSGLIWGAGIGLCLAVPWIFTNYSFAGRPIKLMLIDGAYAAIGCTIMGAVLTLF
ncbi:MAG: DUF1761 domain-containing protein [Pseudomonadota bacterium]